MARSNKSTFKPGRTIGEKREKLETANEREAARKKDKRKSKFRIIITVIIFLALAGVLIALYIVFGVNKEEIIISEPVSEEKTYTPTIEIVDEDAAATEGKITTRMKEYIGKVESDFRDLGYVPVKAVIPANSVREVDFYLDGYPGYIKMITDRDAAISVEDADRMIRYLKGQGKASEFQYIDVRIDGKAYWR